MLSHINIGYHSETICTLWSEVAQSCPTLCDPMDYSLPGFSIHRIFQARVLEWVAIYFTRGSTWHKDQIWVSRIAGRGVTLRATMSSHMHSQFSSVQFSSVAQLHPTLCEPMNLSMTSLPVHHQLPEFTQTHVHRIGNAIQPSHPLPSPSPPAFNLSQHQGVFLWVSSS